jgi:arylsulfatase A-like enzyme
MSRRALRVVLFLILAAGLAAGCWRARSPRYNVLIIVLDTVRGDHVSANGYARRTTPAIDRLAAEGTNFRRASTVAPRTWQSFASILTGLYPPHHGVRFIFDQPLSPDTSTLASVLGATGYATAAFDLMPFVRKIMGDRGFGEFFDLTSRPTTPVPEIVAAQALKEDGRRIGDNFVMGAAWEWIAARGDQPYFAFVRLLAAHWPYHASPANLADFDPCDGHDHAFNEGAALFGMRATRSDGLQLADRAEYRRRFYEPGYDPDTVAHLIAHYDAALRTTDALVGALIERLRERGLLRNTLVIVTADHGEAFGEHGYYTHGVRVDETVMHVPLVIRLPDEIAGARRGQSVDELVRVVDIMPTVLDVLGLPVPPGLDGISLLPVLTGAAPLPALWAYGESDNGFVGDDPDTHLPGVRGKTRMARTPDWKLVLVPKPVSNEVRLFDLRNDPGERVDVADRYPHKIAELQRLLDPFLALDQGDTRVPQLTESQQEQLRQLGYQ